MGGDKAFIRRLDNLFGSSLDPSYYAHTEDVTKEGILGGYIHGNEPSHHIPYLYMWTSQPWKTSENIYKSLIRCIIHASMVYVVTMIAVKCPLGIYLQP